MQNIIDALNKANKMLCGYDCNNTVFLVEAEREAYRLQEREVELILKLEESERIRIAAQKRINMLCKLAGEQEKALAKLKKE